MLAIASEVGLEAMLAGAGGVIRVEAVGIAAFQGRPVMMRLGAVGFGRLRAVGRCARPGVVFNLHLLQALAELPLFDGGIALGLELGLSFSIRSLGLLEDVEDVFALWWCKYFLSRKPYRVCTATYTAHHLAALVDHRDCLSKTNSHSAGTCGKACSCSCSYTARGKRGTCTTCVCGAVRRVVLVRGGQEVSVLRGNGSWLKPTRSHLDRQLSQCQPGL
jgi:hypothetical protein